MSSRSVALVVIAWIAVSEVAYQFTAPNSAASSRQLRSGGLLSPPGTLDAGSTDITPTPLLVVPSIAVVDFREAKPSSQRSPKQLRPNDAPAHSRQAGRAPREKGSETAAANISNWFYWGPRGGGQMVTSALIANICDLTEVSRISVPTIILPTEQTSLRAQYWFLSEATPHWRQRASADCNDGVLAFFHGCLGDTVRDLGKAPFEGVFLALVSPESIENLLLNTISSVVCGPSQALRELLTAESARALGQSAGRLAMSFRGWHGLGRKYFQAAYRRTPRALGAAVDQTAVSLLDAGRTPHRRSSHVEWRVTDVCSSALLLLAWILFMAAQYRQFDRLQDAPPSPQAPPDHDPGGRNACAGQANFRKRPEPHSAPP